MYKNKYCEFVYCKCDCGLTLNKRNYQGRLQYYRFNHYANVLRGTKTGKHSPAYKGGIKIDKDGYRLIWMPEHRLSRKLGYVLEHRYLYEIYHNCSLLKCAEIHHKDENRLNNSKENLEGFTHHKHRHIHKKDMSDRFCLLCHEKTYIQIRKGKIQEHWNKYNNGHVCRKCQRYLGL